MTFWNDVRLAARLLLKDRGFTCAAVMALALALAVTSTVFMLVNGLLLRPLPFDKPEQIVLLSTRRVVEGNVFQGGPSYPELQDWRTGTRTFTGLAGFVERTMNLADEGVAPERLTGALITANTFQLIGRQPLLGRDFAAADDAAGAAPVVILGYHVWQSRYGANPAVLGRTVRVNGVPATVIGVMPDGFGFPQIADLWQPLSALPSAQRDSRSARQLGAIGRLKPGVSRDQAAADLAAVAGDLSTRFPETNAGVTPRVLDFRDRSVGRVRVVFTAFSAAVAFVLLIACANVANLLLARGVDRSREISIRLSMGASRARIVGQLLVESLLLGAVAGLAGLLLSTAGVAAFKSATQAAGDVPYWIDFAIDWRVLGFLICLSLVASALFGLLPALQTSRVALTAVLADGGRLATAGTRNRSWQGGLVVVQIALAVVLLTGAGLALRDLQAQTEVEIGISTSTVTTARFRLPERRYGTPGERAAFYRQLDARLASLPSGPAVLATYPPFNGAETRDVGLNGRPPVPRGTRRPISYLTIGPRYFATFARRPVRGREFTDTDGEGVALVNERFAALYFPAVDPVGHQITLSAAQPGQADDRVTIVGVAPNVRQRSTADRDFDPVVYVPQTSPALPFASMMARSTAGPERAISELRDAMRALDADVPLYDVRSLDGLLEDDRWEARMLSTMFGLFAALALTLAAVGVYAVTAFAVSKRTREIGVRIALGARAHHICLLVTGGAAMQIAIGTALGVAATLAAAPVLAGLLSEIDATDGVTLAAVPLLLGSIAMIACLVPAGRAVRVDPMAALRSE